MSATAKTVVSPARGAARAGAPAPLALETPVPGGGLKWVNFVNGRLLTGDDLRADQSSAAAARRQLSQAGGVGVVTGLTVTAVAGSSAERAIVRVTAGLAVSASGHTLALGSDLELGLVAPAPAPAAPTPNTAPFATIAAPPPVTTLAGGGLYVLLIGAASTEEGSAQLSGQTAVDAGKTFDHLLDNVQFNLAPAPVGAVDLSDDRKARNRTAYGFLGTSDPARSGFEVDPLCASQGPYALLATMTAAGAIGADQVPLAVIRLKPPAGIEFVDMWSVRRRIARAPGGTAGATAVEPRAMIEAEAALLQFHAHIAELGPNVAGKPVVASFDHLPPAGFIPAATGGDIEAMLAPGGFWDGLTVRGPFFINGALVDRLLRDSYTCPPIALSDGGSASQEVIWLYRVRENAQPPSTATPALLFTSGHMQYRANAHFNLGRFDYANYALHAI